ncbi:Gamma-glutamylaminecyclotransferase C [Porphyridium purpureum]|uniref:Gamma-glutamylcyclotransferase family protein n=1 Tax=Porphyridium purpureum TaxID=35688 RepID=A0A5J4YIV5_PORPP|nr:Gamma-glutamylaminecyclotransferase C [Porphyridium purpureum]|eukprot:POR4933..scf210_14
MSPRVAQCHGSVDRKREWVSEKSEVTGPSLPVFGVRRLFLFTFILCGNYFIGIAMSACEVDEAPDGSVAVDHLFLYGTLKRGFPNYVHLPDALKAQPWCEAVTRFPMPLVVMPPFFIPFLIDPADIPAQGDGACHYLVKGELYTLTGMQRTGRAQLLAFLDEFEGVHFGMYRRRAISVQSKSEEQTVRAWSYVRNDEPHRDDQPDWLIGWSPARMAAEIVPPHADYTLELSTQYRSRDDR